MRKFECKRCGIRICTAEYQSGSGIPMKCTALFERDCRAAWQEVKEEERPAKALPNWVKERAPGYDNEQKRYFEVKNVGEKWIDIEYVDDGNDATCDYSDIQKCSEARKRQFTDKEMRGLVGKVFTTSNGDVSIAADYDNYMKSICICFEWFNNEELANSIWQLEGKPCYVLEHLTEKGEWVE